MSEFPTDGIYVSPHSLQRVWQRLRTNSRSDVRSLLLKLAGIADAKDFRGQQLDVKVDGGTFHLVQDSGFQAGQTISITEGGQTRLHTLTETEAAQMEAKAANPCWTIKTFIEDKK